MKFIVNTIELKQILNLVKVVASNAEGTKATAHAVCLLRSNPDTKKLHLDFALNGAFLTYAFHSAQLDGDLTEAVRRTVDMELLTGLKFTGKEVSIDLQTKAGENTLAFSSGNLKGKILVGSAEIEEQVEEARPADDSVDASCTFAAQDWVKALGAHLYGTHHNAVDAQRRPVRILGGDDIIFVSRDKVSSAYTTMSSKHKIDDFDVSLVPSPLHAILSQLPDKDFRFGVKKGVWRVKSGSVDIWFPCPPVKAAKENSVLELMLEIDDKPAYIVQVPGDVLKSCLDELTPLLTATAAKDDMPLLTLRANPGVTEFSISTAKAKDVTRTLEGAENMLDGASDDDREVCLNLRFLQEFMSSLRSLANKTSPVRIRWWAQDASSPLKGRAICVECESNRFIMARVKRSVKQV